MNKFAEEEGNIRETLITFQLKAILTPSLSWFRRTIRPSGLHANGCRLPISKTSDWGGSNNRLQLFTHIYERAGQGGTDRGQHGSVSVT